jgi:hypothetical protein
MNPKGKVSILGVESLLPHDRPEDTTTTIVMIVNLLHNICSCHFHIGVWDGLGIVGGSGIGLWPDPA